MLVTAVGANRNVEVVGIDIAAADLEAGVADLSANLPGGEVLEGALVVAPLPLPLVPVALAATVTPLKSPA